MWIILTTRNVSSLSSKSWGCYCILSTTIAFNKRYIESNIISTPSQAKSDLVKISPGYCLRGAFELLYRPTLGPKQADTEYQRRLEEKEFCKLPAKQRLFLKDRDTTFKIFKSSDWNRYLKFAAGVLYTEQKNIVILASSFLIRGFKR